MLREFLHLRQDPGERPRRWFTGDELELVFWFDEDGTVASLHLYHESLRALAWSRAGDRLAHLRLDDGEGRPFSHKASPILLPAPPADLAPIREAFAREAGTLPEPLAAAVAAALRERAE
jgi:hypothetical protein